MIGDRPPAGSLALGASLAGVGLVFAGVAAVAAQVSESTRRCTGSPAAALGAAYLLRAAGDVGDGTLSWLSPIGWGQYMRPYAGEQWWPLALMAAATACSSRRGSRCARAATRARARPPRPGPPAASPALLRPLGLALRLQRGVIVGWSVGLFFSGVSLGLTGRDADALLGGTAATSRSSSDRARATSSISTSR
jgi:ABC-2 type transport system permease protein